MKKLLSIIIVTLMVLTCVLSASAVEIPETYNSAKLADDLKTELVKSTENDIVGVWVWFTHGLSSSEIDRLTIEKYGPEIAQLEGGNEREKVNNWRRARNEIISEFYTSNNERILAELEIKDSERDFVSSLSPSAILYVPAYKVLSMMEHPEVSGIDLYVFEILDPPIGDGPVPDILPTEPGPDTFPTESEPDSIPTESEPDSIPTESEPDLIPTESEPDTIPTESEPDTIPSESPAEKFMEKFFNFCTTLEEYAPGKVEIWEKKEIGDILIFTGDLTEGAQAPMDGCNEVLGDWVVANTGYYVYGNGLCLYAYDGEKFYTIKEAFDSGIVTDLSAVEGFDEPIFVTRIGDVNRDKKIDVKDATALQKQLAGLDVPVLDEDYRYKGEHAICNFNADDTVNIKDATAIQKHIAELE